jgi:hypothetical protein
MRPVGSTLGQQSPSDAGQFIGQCSGWSAPPTKQISCDSGAGDRVGCFESRVFGAGPQIGYIVPLGTTHQAYFNLKGYKEFGAEHRAEGWNVWFTLAISPAAPQASPANAMIAK